MPGTYQQTLAALYALEAKKGMDFRLSRLDPVLEALGNPERAFACVHLAGTNGKGSTSAMIEGALRAGGHRTGLYTSPHFVSFRERIRTGGVPITRDAVVRQVETVHAAMESVGAELTFFEIATLAAFVEFREQEVAIAVVEAGLGGRLDVTNVVHGDVAVITSVGLDHTEFLGATIPEVAREKAAIIKPGSVAVTGLLLDEAEVVVAARVAEVGAKRFAYGRDFGDFAPLAETWPKARRAVANLPKADGTLSVEATAGEDRCPAEPSPSQALRGAHQLRNAAVAAAAVAAVADRFPVSGADRDCGILGVRWPGRLEVLARRRGDGPLVLDAAHNPEAAVALAASLDSVAAARPRVLVFAAMADKDWPAMLAALVPRFDHVIFSPLPMPRAEDPARFLEVLPSGVVASNPREALELAEEAASAHGSVVVAGSIFLLGNLYRAAGGTLLENDLID